MAAIEADRQGAVLILRIANESKRNAFTHAMTAKLGEQLRGADADRSIRCVIITGAGDVAFSSGHDLREMLADRDAASDPTANDPFVLPSRMSTPTIAAINGFAYAAGFILSLNCDFRVCSENAAFAAPGARIGLLPVAGQLSRLPGLLPRSVAHELLVTCREMKADEALRLGFVSKVVPVGKSLDAARGLAEQIAANSFDVVAAIKNGLEILHTKGATAAAEFEWSDSRRLQAGPDAEEGMRAFLEKRRPNFQ
jgi:enoyl-CoA hydratase/carnithine racemase